MPRKSRRPRKRPPNASDSPPQQHQAIPADINAMLGESITDGINAMRQEGQRVRELALQHGLDLGAFSDDETMEWMISEYPGWTPETYRSQSDADIMKMMECNVLRKARARPAAPPALRIRVAGSTVFLDDQLVPLDMTNEARDLIVEYLSRLIADPGCWVSSGDMGAGHRGQRWDRLFPKLPPVLRNLIETDRRKGRRLKRTAWRK